MCGLQVLDPALTRPGRLSRRVVVPLPDEAGRADILAVHLRNTPMLSEADKEFCRRQIARISSEPEQASMLVVSPWMTITSPIQRISPAWCMSWQTLSVS